MFHATSSPKGSQEIRKIYGYIRVSTVRQGAKYGLDVRGGKDGTIVFHASMNTQKSIIAEKFGKVDKFFEDKDSAYVDNEDRAGFGELMQEIRKNANEGIKSIIYIYDVSRFSRNVDRGLKYMRELNGFDCIVKSADGYGTDTLVKREAFLNKIIQGEQESKENAKRVKDRRDAINAIGGYSGGAISYGKRVFIDEKKGCKFLVPNPEEEKVIKLILDHHEKGNHVRRILSELTKRKITNRAGGEFKEGTIRGIIKKNSNVGGKKKKSVAVGKKVLSEKQKKDIKSNITKMLKVLDL